MSSNSAETPSSSDSNSSIPLTSTQSPSPPSPQSPSDSNSTPPPPPSDNSKSPSSSNPPIQTPPPSQPPQSPPPSPPPQAPPPQSPPPSPPPQTPPPTSSPQTPAPSSTPPPPPTEQQNHAPASSSPNGNGNDNNAASGGNSPPPPAVSSPPSPAVPGNPPSGWQSPPNAQVLPPPPTIKGGDNSSPDTRLAAPTGSPGGGYRPTQQPPSISKLSPTEPTSHTTENSNRNSESSGSKNQETIKIVTGVAVAGAVIIVIVAVLFLVIKRRKKKPTNVYAAEGYLYGKQAGMGNYGMQGYHSSGGNGSQRGNMYHGPFKEPTGIGNSQVAFTYEQVMKITNSFSQQNVIGGGGFGPVYKGFLPDGRPVAVKQLKVGSGQGEREFRAEVEIISRVHHRHLVTLVGYCICEEQRLLIYEFVPNNTLEHHLHGNGMPVLEWSKRLKVAIGAAKGLSYLHDDCHPKIIHRDIKSANILLDEAFEAKVADFGLAKLTNDAHTHVSTRVMGTFGYMAPEYASSGKLTDKSDVFSFGVVLLELVTGRKSVDPSQPLGEESLVEWARPYLYNAIETRDLSKLVDPRLGTNYVEDEMFRMIESAAACIRHSAPKRPRILQVTRALDSEAAMNDLSNGFKYGQSTIYDSTQYNQDILRFKQMVQGSSDFDMSSGEYISRDSSQSQ